MKTHVFSFPTLIFFGPGSRAGLADHLKANRAKRVLIVTDAGVAGQPFFFEFTKALGATGLQVATFHGVKGNPVKGQVIEGVAAYKKHEADSIIGIGGGAALDVAKAVALMAHHPGDLFDYEDGKPGALPMDKDIPFWVALPTTSGTGSEVGRSTVISDEATHIKKIIFSPRLLAKAVFADPELTIGLPAPVTAATGMDALTHCVESYLAKDYHPICDGIALEGLRLAAGSLSQAVKSPKDMEARSAMMMSSMMGAIAFQKGLGLTHSCAHALSTVADLHHGLANGIMIDYALKYNLTTSADRFKQLAIAANLSNQSGEGFLRWLHDLKMDIKIPEKLRETTVKQDQLPRLAQLALEDSCHQNNPRPCTKQTFEKIYAEAY
jgi:alcohol dehydrogenase class IV